MIECGWGSRKDPWVKGRRETFLFGKCLFYKLISKIVLDVTDSFTTKKIHYIAHRNMGIFKGNFFHDKSMRIIFIMVLMLFLSKYTFKYVMYKHICIVSKFYWQKFLLSILLTNDKALANKADRVKKMPIEYLHFSLINF